MGLDATTLRRILGAIVLAGAVLMLVLGLTLWWGRLSNLGFVVYWLTCFALTGLAMIIAFMDARALRERTRRDERALLEKTLNDIVTDAKARNRAAGRAGTKHDEPKRAS